MDGDSPTVYLMSATASVATVTTPTSILKFIH